MATEPDEATVPVIPGQLALAAAVHVEHPVTRERLVLEPGAQPPPELTSLITNPDAWTTTPPPVDDGATPDPDDPVAPTTPGPTQAPADEPDPTPREEPATVPAEPAPGTSARKKRATA